MTEASQCDDGEDGLSAEVGGSHVGESSRGRCRSLPVLHGPIAVAACFVCIPSHELDFGDVGESVSPLTERQWRVQRRLHQRHRSVSVALVQGSAGEREQRTIPGAKDLSLPSLPGLKSSTRQKIDRFGGASGLDKQVRESDNQVVALADYVDSLGCSSTRRSGGSS